MAARLEDERTVAEAARSAPSGWFPTRTRPDGHRQRTRKAILHGLCGPWRSPQTRGKLMALTDEQLLDFDHDRLAHFELDKAQQALSEQRDAYRPQLVLACWIDGWRERMAAHEKSPTGSNEEGWIDGFDYAARELAANLRQGDFLPGGVLHDETDDGRL